MYNCVWTKWGFIEKLSHKNGKTVRNVHVYISAVVLSHNCVFLSAYLSQQSNFPPSWWISFRTHPHRAPGSSVASSRSHLSAHNPSHTFSISHPVLDATSQSATITTFCKGTRAARKASTCRVYMAVCAALSWWWGDTSRSAQRRLYRASWQIALQSSFSCTSSWENMIDDLHRHLYPFSPPIAEILSGREKLAVKTHLSTFLKTPLRAFYARKVSLGIRDSKDVHYWIAFSKESFFFCGGNVKHKWLLENCGITAGLWRKECKGETIKEKNKTTVQLRQKTSVC